MPEAAVPRGGVDPLAFVASGVAIGLMVGALLPQGKPESRLLAPLGNGIARAATALVGKAKAAVRAELGSLPLTRKAVDAKMKRVVEAVAG